MVKGASRYDKLAAGTRFGTKCGRSAGGWLRVSKMVNPATLRDVLVAQLFRAADQDPQAACKVALGRSGFDARCAAPGDIVRGLSDLSQCRFRLFQPAI
jgi:hypothetical protein